MAIAMQQRMRDLQAEWRERGQEHVFQLRIGINTGFCTVGNFGSDDRVDYTIIGNEVNLAARLQSHADLGGILLAHETYALVKDEVLTEETGTITVKGFSRPVRTHRVVGALDDAGTRADHPAGAGRLPADRRPEEADARGQGRRDQDAAGGGGTAQGLSLGRSGVPQSYSGSGACAERSALSCSTCSRRRSMSRRCAPICAPS